MKSSHSERFWPKGYFVARAVHVQCCEDGIIQDGRAAQAARRLSYWKEVKEVKEGREGKEVKEAKEVKEGKTGKEGEEAGKEGKAGCRRSRLLH